jgi:hypothetical protein
MEWHSPSAGRKDSIEKSEKDSMDSSDDSVTRTLVLGTTTTTTATISTPTAINNAPLDVVDSNSSSSSSTSGDGVPEEPVVESWFKGKRVLVVDDGKEERSEVMYFLFTFRTSCFSGPRDQKVPLKRLLGASKMSPAASREVPECLW